MRRGRTPLLLALLAACALAAGCGGSGGGKDDAHLGRQDLARRADAICGAAAAKLRALGEPPATAGVGRAADYFARAAAIAGEQQRSLDALQPAAGERDAWRTFTGQERTAAELLGRLAAAARARDTAQAATLLRTAQAVQASIARAAARVGAHGCGSP